MEITNRELLVKEQDLLPLYGNSKPIGFRLGVKANYAVRKNFNQIQSALKELRDIGRETYLKHNAKDEKGELKITDEEDMKKVNEELAPLYELKQEIEFHKVDEHELYVEENKFSPAFIDRLSFMINEN